MHKTFFPQAFVFVLHYLSTRTASLFVCMWPCVKLWRLVELQAHSAASDLGIIWCEVVDFVRKFGALMRLGSSLGALCEQISINVKFFLFLKNYRWLNL